MASILKVDQIQGLSTAANVHIPGHVVQVLESTASADFVTASTSVVQGPTTDTLTLKNSSNKVLVFANFLGSASTSGNYNGARFALYRGTVSGTRITSGTEPQLLTYSQEIWAWQTLQKLDTPASATVTYSIGLWRHSNATNAKILGSYGQTVITLMEIAQ
ncbi:MAG: hypothetical protein CBC57_05870 [Euryarchaeota archaeon TMED97]|nr:MAG: hypothetical protein CBC57_05870 [Euryarchaeota archaeon TMED97]|tara:strand:- start:2076 stop:2558 length:483 start_codon:yes stop_codon:yes gene_type:complete